MNEPRIIGVTGYARSGKDTIYYAIRRLHPGPVVRVAIADTLKVLAARTLGVTASLDEVREWTDLLKTEGTEIVVRADDGRTMTRLTGRKLLQNLSNAGRDLFGDDFWLDHTNFDIDAAVLVVPRLSFDNEALAIREMGGEVWRVVRGGVGAINDDRTETPISDHLLDRTIENHGSVEDLDRQIEMILLGQK